MIILKNHANYCYFLFLAIMGASSAWSKEPRDWQIGLQNPLSPVMEQLYGFHDFMLVIITLITIFVLALLIFICIKFSSKRNPIPSKTSHNTLIEIVWTAIPILILIAIAIPSIRILHFVEKTPEAEMTLKVIGYQWYWGYQYPDHDDISFESYMIQDADLKPGEKRLLDVDNEVVLPIDTVVRIQVTAADVMHNWAVPSLGIKKDAIPGRLNETWLKINEPGIYYGQCSELCGSGHGFMPIRINAMRKEDFKSWVSQAKDKFASNQKSNAIIASVQ